MRLAQPLHNTLENNALVQLVKWKEVLNMTRRGRQWGTDTSYWRFSEWMLDWPVSESRSSFRGGLTVKESFPFHGRLWLPLFPQDFTPIQFRSFGKRRDCFSLLWDRKKHWYDIKWKNILAVKHVLWNYVCTKPWYGLYNSINARKISLTSSFKLVQFTKLNMWPWSTNAVLSRWGIFVAIAKNTLYGSKWLIFLLCQKWFGH